MRCEARKVYCEQKEKKKKKKKELSSTSTGQARRAPGVWQGGKAKAKKNKAAEEASPAWQVFEEGRFRGTRCWEGREGP